MLRLTAKHRGIEDAVRLARRDQSIEYTVADAKTHTFRSDHDELRMTYLSDGSPYKPEHTIITANGIKPASVMSWIHREKPGSPHGSNGHGNGSWNRMLTSSPRFKPGIPPIVLR